MSSIKCPNCGLTNFATADTCKRCKQSLDHHPYSSDNGSVEPKQDWSNLQTVPAVPDEAVNPADYGDGSHSVGNILFAIYLALSIILMFYTLLFINSESTNELRKMVTVQWSTLYLPSFETLYYSSFLGTVVLLPTAAILLMTLLRKSKAFLTLVFVYLLGEFLYAAIEGVLVWGVEGELRGKHIPEFDIAANQIQWLPLVSIASILLTIVWFRYFTKSERARVAFE